MCLCVMMMMAVVVMVDDHDLETMTAMYIGDPSNVCTTQYLIEHIL